MKAIVSMMVMCNGVVIVITEHDRRRIPGLLNAPTVMEHDNNRDHRGIYE